MDNSLNGSVSHASLDQGAEFVGITEFCNLHARCVGRGGELMAIETIFLKKTSAGGPRAMPRDAEAKMYILCVVDAVQVSPKSITNVGIPASKYVQWSKYAPWNLDLRQRESMLPLGSLHVLCGGEGNAFYRVILGDDEVVDYLESLSTVGGGSENDLLAFWSAWKQLGVDLSADATSVADALEKKRGEALHTYVRGKALLFADESSGVNKLFAGDKRRSVDSSTADACRMLLDLGLSKEAIAYRAREYAYEKLGI